MKHKVEKILSEKEANILLKVSKKIRTEKGYRN
jgi:hypothetical protein